MGGLRLQCPFCAAIRIPGAEAGGCVMMARLMRPDGWSGDTRDMYMYGAFLYAINTILTASRTISSRPQEHQQSPHRTTGIRYTQRHIRRRRRCCQTIWQAALQQRAYPALLHPPKCSQNQSRCSASRRSSCTLRTPTAPSRTSARLRRSYCT
jgi:hypothetical protein